MHNQLAKNDPPPTPPSPIDPDKPPVIPDCDEVGVPRNICKAYDWIVDNVKVYPDHIMINNTFPILRTNYFSERLNDLEYFDGFSPRWIIPQTRMVKSTDVDHLKVVT